jgi:hypothetical protein
MKNILLFMILVYLLSCSKDNNAPGGPSTIMKRGEVIITVSYVTTCDSSLNWGKITISIARTKADLEAGSVLGSKSFITGVDPSKEPFSTLLAPGTYYYKVSLLSFCKTQLNFEEIGSFIIQDKQMVRVNVSIHG